MDYLSRIRKPIESEFSSFKSLFNDALTFDEGILSQALSHIRQRQGKQMRPMITLLCAKNFGQVCESTLHSAVALELLHTASLTHDDVVDESNERRGQASLNAAFTNRVSILVGDYILSTCLLHASYTKSLPIIESISKLGRTLAAGEILQLQNIDNNELSEASYFKVISQKTASLFEACACIGAQSVGASDEIVEKAKAFGLNIGLIFQIRDDIFDYYDSEEVGKPTGADMAEGKLTLPILYALKSTHNDEMIALAKKVKSGVVKPDEIARLVGFAKDNGGIDYARRTMDEIGLKVQTFIDKNVTDPTLKDAFTAYLDYAIIRNI